jgi:hypothetical protein
MICISCDLLQGTLQFLACDPPPLLWSWDAWGTSKLISDLCALRVFVYRVMNRQQTDASAGIHASLTVISVTISHYKVVFEFSSAVLHLLLIMCWFSIIIKITDVCIYSITLSASWHENAVYNKLSAIFILQTYSKIIPLPAAPSYPPHTLCFLTNSLIVSHTLVAILFSLTQIENTKSVALACKWTIPTERPPLVGEVGANSCRQRVSQGQCSGSARLYSWFSRPE